ncbi:MAG TPA: cupin domain-containing protein [Silvibacterium sp.]|jgi:quercetin dioxygenase-like cupin family protein|nr:cupin domain-containing protein [Silvibacterium sp.]
MSNNQVVYVQEAPSYIFLGVTMQIHLSGEQTGGEFSLIEAVMPPGGDGGLHVHSREDESVHMLDGSLQVTVGQQTFTLKAGQTYFAPRDIPHRLTNTGNVPARALLINTPGTFDEFVSIAGVTAGQDTPAAAIPDADQVQRLLALAEEFGVKILAPPELPVRI